MTNTKEQAILMLEDGTCFLGESCGKSGKAFGMVAFNTGMVGYQQLLTDPASQGLLTIQTFPLIGNYGINKTDFESDKPQVAGYIMREICDIPSNYKCEKTLGVYLEETGVVAISDIDTRQLVRHIRENGEMRGVVATGEIDRATLLDEVKAWQEEKCSYKAISKKVKGENSTLRIAALDFGMSSSQMELLASMSGELAIFGGDASIEEIMEFKPDGIVLSNGGGNPTDYKDEIELVKKVMELEAPVLAIGLGHQLLALANGMTVEKLKHGHRGANQPVYCKKNGRTYITSQNHGYIVSADSVKNCEINYSNSNDKTVEGLSYKNAESVQFIPDTFEGVQSTKFIYDEFFKAVKDKKGEVN